MKYSALYLRICKVFIKQKGPQLKTIKETLLYLFKS